MDGRTEGKASDLGLASSSGWMKKYLFGHRGRNELVVTSLGRWERGATGRWGDCPLSAVADWVRRLAHSHSRCRLAATPDGEPQMIGGQLPTGGFYL